MQKPGHNIPLYKGSLWLLAAVGLFLLSACGNSKDADRLNALSYYYHYRDLDSTEYFARQAYEASRGYGNGKAEALNNMAFVAIMKMDYTVADSLLSMVERVSDSEVELLVADIQQMRLCQRQSRNKEFYDFYENGRRRLRRIQREADRMSDHARRRMVYARSEYAIVASAYYYYVGMHERSAWELEAVDTRELLDSDTAQYLNYAYNVGAGGIIEAPVAEETAQAEYDWLMRCYSIAVKGGYTFWQANALEAITEHVMTAESRGLLGDAYLPSLKSLGMEAVPDSIVPAALANECATLFTRYGDVYQIAGGYRTLATCYFNTGDYPQCIACLQRALNRDSVITRAPDLVASIREQLSMAYAAVNDKQQSDYNRNEYLDMQEVTRQDRYLEARASQFDAASMQLTIILIALAAAIVALLFLLWRFNRLRHGSRQEEQEKELLAPLKEWQKKNDEARMQLSERVEGVYEATKLNEVHILNNRKRNVENRAKVSLVISITPFIDRIIHETGKLRSGGESENLRQQRFNYVAELTDKINEYNSLLTEWIQLRQGEISLHIESFPVQQLFDIVARGSMSFQLKGLTLNVVCTDAMVKADRILTLFMINTLCDNARKFTPEGGTVEVEAVENEQQGYVEISITDTGCGIDEQQLSSIFDHKVYQGHGFGLMNCKGIIEKYKKMSRLFSVCHIGAESEPGKGSRFFFRLPRVVRQLVMALLLLLPSSVSADFMLDPSSGPATRAAYTEEGEYPEAQKATAVSAADSTTGAKSRAAAFADSAYYSNIAGTFARTIAFADSCEQYLSENDSDYLAVAADISNEAAVAALALKDWQKYKDYNARYISMFKQMTADNTLGLYCIKMKKSAVNKSVALALLFIILLSILPAYYFLYYRHRLNYRYSLEKVAQMNEVLLSDKPMEEKLSLIRTMRSGRFPASLALVAKQITEALEENVAAEKSGEESLILAEDGLRRAEYEDNQLYVSNNVTDNSLSTLKHETMYYPNRIKQLIEGGEPNLQAVDEVAEYYKEIYGILTLQAQSQTSQLHYHLSQVDIAGQEVRGDADMIKYLFDILKRQNAGEPLDITAAAEGMYVRVKVLMSHLRISADEAKELFTPAEGHIPYLICRQIVRDHGDATGRRGCGISADIAESGETEIIIILPIWKSLK